MKLRFLRARNFRLLEQFTLQLCPDVTVVIGPNNVGKSNVVDALLLLRDAILRPILDAAGARQGFEKLVSQHEVGRVIRLEIGLSAQEEDDFYWIEFDRLGIVHERSKLGSFTYSSDRDASTDRLECRGPGSGRYHTALNGPLCPLRPPDFEPLSHFLTEIVHVDPFRNVSTQSGVGFQQSIHPTGTNLATVLHYYYTTDRERFDAYEEAVRKVLPDVELVETPLLPSGGPSTTVSIRFRGSRTKHDLGALSSGIKGILVLIAAAYFSPLGSLLLIEEAENHLHPGAQKGLCAVFRELAVTQQKQFLLTTHSDVVVRQFETDHCMFMDRSGSGSTATCLTAVDVYTAWERLGIESSVLEVLGQTRQIVVVLEGRSDSKALEPLWRHEGLAEKLRPVRAMGGGWGEIVVSAAGLREALKRFRIPSSVFVLLDNDGEGQKKTAFLSENGFGDDTAHVWSQKEIESYLILPSALAAISGHKADEIQRTIKRAEGGGKARLDWVLKELGIADTPLNAIVTNTCRTAPSELPAEFLEVSAKLKKLLE